MNSIHVFQTKAVMVGETFEANMFRNLPLSKRGLISRVIGVLMEEPVESDSRSQCAQSHSPLASDKAICCLFD